MSVNMSVNQPVGFTVESSLGSRPKTIYIYIYAQKLLQTGSDEILLSFFLSFLQRNLDLGHEHSEWFFGWFCGTDEWSMVSNKQSFEWVKNPEISGELK